MDFHLFWTLLISHGNGDFCASIHWVQHNLYNCCLTIFKFVCIIRNLSTKKKFKRLAYNCRQVRVHTKKIHQNYSINFLYYSAQSSLRIFSVNLTKQDYASRAIKVVSTASRNHDANRQPPTPPVPHASLTRRIKILTNQLARYCACCGWSGGCSVQDQTGELACFVWVCMHAAITSPNVRTTPPCQCKNLDKWGTWCDPRRLVHLPPVGAEGPLPLEVWHVRKRRSKSFVS